MSNENQLERFELTNGQFYAVWKLKNQHWFLNDTKLGFGDLSLEDISRIQERLVNGETFYGYNEHHLGHWMQRENPMIIITPGNIEYPEHKPVTKETRDKVRGLL